MKHWEYTVIQTTYSRDAFRSAEEVATDQLNWLGAEEGWELVAVVASGCDGHRLFFKRSREDEFAALTAVQAVGSVSDVADLQTVVTYLLDAKVKVERMPSGSFRDALAEVVAGYLCFKELWQNKVDGDFFLLPSRVSRYEDSFPGIRSVVTPSGEWARQNRGEPRYAVVDLMAYMLLDLKKRIAALALSNP